MHEYLTSSINSPISLYIHIPFCTKKCPYCAFYKESYDKNLEKKFITALCNEIISYKVYNIRLKSIFFGGGTPSKLSAISFKKIFSILNQTFQLSVNTECTIECNPEDITTKNLQLFETLPINRLSLGIQSFNEDELKFLGRTHSLKQLHHALSLLKNSSITNFNLDLMYGLPISTLTHLNFSLSQCLIYKPTHISTYCLSIENGTQFEKKNILPLHSFIEADHYLYIKKTLTKQNYQHYEVSAFAQKGFTCTHNLSYWQFEPYLGIGPSAHSFLFPYRFQNKSSLKKYLQNPNPAWTHTKINKSKKNHLVLEFFCSTLRLYQGCNLEYFKKIFNSLPTKEILLKLKLMEKSGLLTLKNNKLKCTPKGMLLLNEILLNLTD